MIFCHSSPSGPSFPPAPPTPAGFIACVGHVNSYVNVSSQNNNVWYAFWSEASDSSRATLIVGVNPSRIDTEFLGRDSSGWGFFVNDSILPDPRLTVYVTPDSVIEGSFGVDAGTYYYLKKLN